LGAHIYHNHKLEQRPSRPPESSTHDASQDADHTSLRSNFSCILPNFAHLQSSQRTRD
jgi:hypothetical protein